jgi:hypothetical protein
MRFEVRPCTPNNDDTLYGIWDVVCEWWWESGYPTEESAQERMENVEEQMGEG